MGGDLRTWAARRRLADAYAALAVAQAHGLDPGQPDLEELHPGEFARAVHVWSLAHPPQPEPVPPARAGARTPVPACELTRSRTGALLCDRCEEWVFPEELAVDPDDGSWWLNVCRRCAARGEQGDG